VAPDKGLVAVDPGVVAETSAVVEARIGTAATLIQVFAERP